MAAAAASVSALPMRGSMGDYSDLAQRSTSEDLAYLEARYAPDVDYKSFFARELQPEPERILSRREIMDEGVSDLEAREFDIIKALFGRHAVKPTDTEISGFTLMRSRCAKIERKSKKDSTQVDKKATKKAQTKCGKFVDNLETILGEQIWGYTHWLEITGETEVPLSVGLDLMMLKPAVPKGGALPAASAPGGAAPSPAGAASTKSNTMPATTTTTATSAAPPPPYSAPPPYSPPSHRR